MINLEGPDVLPVSLDLRPGKVIHKFEDSFTDTIPGSWVKSGLKVRIEAGEKIVEFNNLEIGAPNRFTMRMFDIHCFKESFGTPEGDEWFKELNAKLPTAGIELRREKAIFPEITIPPRGGFKAIRMLELDDYWDSTGVKLDGEQLAVSEWKNALRDAAGTWGYREFFFINYFGTPRGGGETGLGRLQWPL